jgi:dihydrofolate reductase
MRAQCSAFVKVSLDGFIARPDGRTDWLATVERKGEDYGYGAFLDTIDALVIGRRTYERALKPRAWPYSNKRCIVMSRVQPGSSKHGEEFSSESPKKLVRRLTTDGSKRICVDGGAVIRSFLAAGLVTDMTISVVPVLLGTGISLFGNTGPAVHLELVESRSFESGLVQHQYRVGRNALPDARRAKPRERRRRAVEAEPSVSRPKDVIGFLLALPMDPNVEEVSRLAHEFGITGEVWVKTYTSPNDNVSFQLLEGDPAYYVTRWPRDMDGFVERLADTLLERFGGPLFGSTMRTP